jgi:hypothetical protein
MQGDQQDFLLRLKQVLPLRWFPDQTPVLDTLLTGIATAWAWSYGLLQTVKAQARIATMSGNWLDLASTDYFGPQLPRRSAEQDGAFRRRIQLELVRERGTRSAVSASLLDLTGRAPRIFEPANPFDTGGYGNIARPASGLAYGLAGGWGNLDLNFQFFLTAYRPTGGGIASVSGWACNNGGYGQGAIEYAALSDLPGLITDADIYGAVASVLPAGVIAWTQISS